MWRKGATSLHGHFLQNTALTDCSPCWSPLRKRGQDVQLGPLASESAAAPRPHDCEMGLGWQQMSFCNTCGRRSVGPVSSSATCFSPWKRWHLHGCEHAQAPWRLMDVFWARIFDAEANLPSSGSTSRTYSTTRTACHVETADLGHFLCWLRT